MLEQRLRTFFSFIIAEFEQVFDHWVLELENHFQQTKYVASQQ